MLVFIIIFLAFVVLGVVCLIMFVGVGVHDTAMRSKATKLALELGYENYRDAIMGLGLARTRSHRMVPASEVFHALHQEQYDRRRVVANPAVAGASGQAAASAQFKCSKCGKMVHASMANCPQCGHQGRVRI